MTPKLSVEMISDWDGQRPFTPGETEQLLAWYAENHGEGNLDLVKFAKFLIETDSATMKQYLRYCRAIVEGVGGQALPVGMLQLQILSYYVVVRNDRGILYECVGARKSGASKSEVLETIRLAYLESGPPGMNAVAELTEQYLRDWPEGERSGSLSWPKGWTPTSGSAETVLDVGSDRLTDAEMSGASQMSELAGPTPRTIQRLAALHPSACKAYLFRLQSALSGPLPRQVIPLLSLFVSVALVRPNAMRMAMERAKKLGVGRSYVIETVFWALLYCGQTGIDVVADTVWDVMDEWEK
jgi:alkylhydroperoxidase/carboxymuconolactone decarboxylase family protein YurZ